VLSLTSGAAQLTVLPQRARVLDVVVDGVSAYWTDPTTDDWNVGGDRLWVGPEWAWFWSDLSTTDIATHVVQPVNGRGSWQVDHQDSDSISVSQTGRLEHLHGGSALDVSLSRQITRLGPDSLGLPVEAAYRCTSRLELLDPAPDAEANLWTLLQVPPGGTCVVPEAGDLAPVDFFASAPEGVWRTDAGTGSAELGGTTLFKLGLPPHHGVDRFCYDRALPDGRHLLVVREFTVEPGQRYPDVPHHDLHGQGSAIQVFTDGGRLGAFSEVEHHSPAASANHPVVTDSVLTGVTLLASSRERDAWLVDWQARGLGR
jgi:hypothetical protein